MTNERGIETCTAAAVFKHAGRSYTVLGCWASACFALNGGGRRLLTASISRHERLVVVHRHVDDKGGSRGRENSSFRSCRLGMKKT